MRLTIIIVSLAALFSSHVAAAPSGIAESRKAFREAVEEYQIFVVPHCAAEEVEAYNAARGARDRSFVQSLRKSKLAGDYKRAVKDRAKEDQMTVFHCAGPPPPPPAQDPTGSSQPLARSQEYERKSTLTEHFAAGDQQFAAMVRLRDAFNDLSGK